LPEITDYLEEKIVQVRFARLVGAVIWAFGSFLSIAGLFLRLLPLVVVGFSILFAGLYLSVYYELQRLDYKHSLERLEH